MKEEILKTLKTSETLKVPWFQLLWVRNFRHIFKEIRYLHPATSDNPLPETKLLLSYRASDETHETRHDTRKLGSRYTRCSWNTMRDGKWK